MQHSSYPEKQYRRTNAFGTLIVEHDPDDDMIRATITKNGGSMTIRLTPESAAVLAGFLLSKHPAIVKGDALAFSTATRACDAIPEPDFTVITPGHELLATPEKQVAKDDEQEPGVGELHPDQERRLTALREASIIFGSDLSHDRIVGLAEWVLSGNAPTN